MTKAFTDVYEIASYLSKHDDVDNVQAREGRITVAHIPDDRHAEDIPLELFTFINDAIEGTEYQWEASEDPSPSLVENTVLSVGFTTMQ